MSEQLSLNGKDWLFKDFVGEDWIWRNAEKPHTRDTRWWRLGTVPGSVHHDLLTLGEIPNPYYERNSLLCEWVPERTWIYKKTFTINPSYKGKRIQLHFKGVDYEAQFFINGEKIGCHKGMFTPAIFEVGDQLKFDEENLLAVVIERAPDEEPQVSKTSKVHTHKSRMTYWWDFCPRMIHIGIWDDVYLDISGPVRIDNVFVRPQLNDDFRKADISVSAGLSSEVYQTIWAEIFIKQDGKTVAKQCSKHAVAPGMTPFNACLEVEKPKLWYPNGEGKSHLYEAEINLYPESSHESSHQQSHTFGIRKVKLIANENADEEALPYTFVVNGKKTYIKGWNWVPIDAMHGAFNKEKLEYLLTLAERAHVNLLRVWGGGLIEKEAFYDMCNRKGIMVWQEFIQSSSGIENKPSEDPAFIDMMVKEAETIIPLKRNHPSLVVWCGGNELHIDEDTQLDNREPVLGALHDTIKRLDPDRHWFPTSPSGKFFSNTIENIKKNPKALHDVHGPWEHQGLTAQYTLYNFGTSLFNSEFGVEGMTNLKTLNATISKQNQWPATKDNPIWFHRGSWWINEPLIQEAFDGIRDIETLMKASQFLQAEGLRYALEANRRRKFQNSGSLPWQFNEPFPNGYCTSSVDYFGIPKAAYYAVANAYKALTVTARFSSQTWENKKAFQAEIWTNNSVSSQIEDTYIEAALIDAYGNVVDEKRFESVNFFGNSSTQVGNFQALLSGLTSDVFFLDLKWRKSCGDLLASNRYLFSKSANLAPMLSLPNTNLSTQIEKHKNQWSVTIQNEGSYAALLVRLENDTNLHDTSYTYFSDNHFTLLPGESKKVVIEWMNAEQDNRCLSLNSWNSETIPLNNHQEVSR